MQKKNITRLTALFLTAGMLLGGCSAKPETNMPSEKTASEAGQTVANMVDEDGTWRGQGGCYKLTDPGLAENVESVLVHGEELYALTIDFTEETILMSVTHGEEILYQTSDIREAAAGDSGIWVLEDTTDYTVSSQHEFALLQIGYDKQELLKQDITKYIEDSYPVDMRLNRQGQVFILLEGSALIFNADGSFLCSISLGRDASSLVLGGDGNVYVLTGNNSEGSNTFSGIGNVILDLNPDTRSADVLAEYEDYKVCDGGDDYLFTIVNDEGFYGVSSAGEAGAPIALWGELGMSFIRLRSVQWMSDNRFLIRDATMTAILEPTDPSSIKPKMQITMSSVSPWTGFTSFVTDFNLQSEKYTVKIIDYTKSGELGSADAVTALNLDILSGNAPDLFDFSGLPANYYTAKGLVEDLYPYIDQDPELSREDFMLLDKIQTDDKLWYLPSHYYLESMAGLRSRFGDRYSWSLDEYLQMQDEFSSDMMYAVTKEGFLNTMVYRYAGDAVDWKAGTCDFDNKDFIKILNSTAMIRENPEPAGPADLNYTPGGKRLSEGSLLVSTWFVDNAGSVAQARAEAGEELSFIGWPTPDGSSGTRLYASNLMGICSQGNQEGAWEFVKYVLTEASVTYRKNGIPINRSVFEDLTAEVLAGSDKPDEVPVTQEDVDQFRELMEHSVYYGTASEEVVNIIMEEAAPFLAGDRTAEDTARIIQSRISILVAE